MGALEKVPTGLTNKQMDFTCITVRYIYCKLLQKRLKVMAADYLLQAVNNCYTWPKLLQNPTQASV